MQPLMTPQEIASFTFRLTGGRPNPEATASTFRQNAQTMRDYAEKARKAKGGKYRGYTAAQAEAMAIESEARAVTVPAILRKMMGA